MSECILLKSSSGGNSDECTATKAQVLNGYKAITSDSSDEAVNGGMANNGIITKALNCGNSYTITTGYHNGSGKITVNSLASQTVGNLAKNKILKGYYGHSNGSRVDGDIAVSNVASFTAAAYSTSQILCTWKNPAKGPYSGVIICAKTGSYPANINDNRKYTGTGNNAALSGMSSVTLSGFIAGTTYYFRIWMYCTCSAGDLYSGYLQTTCAPTAHGRQAYTSSGTFTVPAGVRSIDIHCTGGGGSGGDGSSSPSSDSGNGGGGGYTSYKKAISVTPGQNISITVGAGGFGSGSRGYESYVTINGSKTITANGGAGAKSGSSTGHGGSGGGAGAYNSYGGTVGYGGVGGSDGSDGAKTKRPNDQGWGADGWRSGGMGQETSTREFGEAGGVLYSGGGGGAGGNQSSCQGGAGGAGGGGRGGNGMGSGTPAGDGSVGTGGGGGGLNYRVPSSLRVGKGGSGNVIIRW